MTDTIQRFSNRVDNYIKYRPDYPREIIGWLREQGVLRDDSIIADVGCGPGTSTRMFLENGNRVFGVEPNAAMRAAAVEYLNEFSDFKPIDGTSDNTNLNDSSVDLVVAAQAFHWFKPEPTRKEFRRILKPGGAAVLMWNVRLEDATPFLVEYESLIASHSVDYHVVRHNNIGDDEVKAFLGPDCQKAVFQNKQVFDFDGLKGRLLSSSYIPTEGHERHPAMIDELKTLFAKHNQNGKIEILYDTNVYLSRL